MMVEMLNIRFTLLLIFAIQVFNVRASYGRAQSGPACDPADPVPPRRLRDPGLIKGVWKSRFVKLSRGFPLRALSTDFDIVIGKPFENGSIPLEETFRGVLTCNCENNLMILLPKDTKKNAFTPLNPGIIKEWQLIDFFGEYLIATVCFELDNNERCLRPTVTVYSRTPDPIPLADLKDINQSLRKTMCIDLFEDFHEEARSGEASPLARPSSYLVEALANVLAEKHIQHVQEMKIALLYICEIHGIVYKDLPPSKTSNKLFIE